MRHDLLSVRSFLLAVLTLTTGCTPGPRSGRDAAPTPAARRPVPGAPAGAVAFVNVGVVPMDKERVLTDQTVLVQNGWITALGPSTKVTVPAAATRIDGRGQYLIPGLTDCHAHIGHRWKEWSQERTGAADRVAAADSLAVEDSVNAERGLLLWLASGVTTLRNMDYAETEEQILPGPTLLRLRARAAAGALSSPRIYTSGTGWRSHGRPAGTTEAQDVADYLAGALAPRVLAYQAAGYDHLKVHGEAGVMLDSLLTIGRRVGLPIVGHVGRGNGNYPVARALALGMTSIEHLGGYTALNGPAGVRDTSIANVRAEAAATRRAGTWNCPTLTIIGASGSMTPGSKPFHSGRFIKALQDAGAGLLVGTDASGGYVRTPSTLHRELATYVQAGLTPYQALATGTTNAAAYFGTLDSTGTVAVGKRADLVLLSGNPLQDIWHTMASSGVMIGGRWLARGELERRLAVLPRGPQYPARAAADVVFGFINLISNSRPVLSTSGPVREQWETFQRLQKTHAAVRQALRDSLGVSGAGEAGQRRELALIARQAGELRALLIPEQQQLFDAQLRAWQAARAADGFPVAVPGVSK